MHRIAIWVWILALCGCTSTTAVVYSEDATRRDGALASLPSILESTNGNPSSPAPVELVFIHGVGDHCPGYALGPQEGAWLNQWSLPSIGLRAISPIEKDPPIDVSVFMGGAKDGRSLIEMERQHFLWQFKGAGQPTPVRVTEITWSKLTQWIKTDSLAYDSPSQFPRDKPLPDCIPRPDPAVVPYIQNPPSRLALNEYIKESVLNRDLSDAVLYAGTYGAVIERGVAEAICRVVSNTQDSVGRCVWPPPTAIDQRTRYIFVTHSLGGRILYDTLIHLTGNSTQAKSNPFVEPERSAAGPAVSFVLGRTAAVYMMANQLALIGLADVDPCVRSSDPLYPSLTRVERSGCVFSSRVGEQGKDGNVTGISTSKDVLSALGTARQAAVVEDQKRSSRPLPPDLAIVAFNDTNDLLSWYVPPWYASPASKGPAGIHVTDVFVDNAPHWFVVEHPGDAHSWYFRNDAVLRTIMCGAADGHPLC